MKPSRSFALVAMRAYLHAGHGKERWVQAGGFPVDLVLFAMVAAFLVLRLRSILGKRTGFEGAPRGPAQLVPRRAAEPPVDVAPARPLPDPAGPVSRTMAAMQAADRRFDPAAFLAGAEHAFRLIVDAFAAGDRARLRPLLSETAFQSFESVIAAREAAGETQRTEIRDIEEATITDAALSGAHAALTVRFVSRQINLSADREGHVLAGTDGVTEISDLWTFERDLGGGEAPWRLTSARSA